MQFLIVCLIKKSKIYIKVFPMRYTIKKSLTVISIVVFSAFSQSFLFSQSPNLLFISYTNPILDNHQDNTVALQNSPITLAFSEYNITAMPTYKSGSIAVPFIIQDYLNKNSYDIVIFNTLYEDIINNENSSFVTQAIEGAIRKILFANLNTKIVFLHNNEEPLSNFQNEKSKALTTKILPIVAHYKIEFLNLSNSETTLQEQYDSLAAHIKKTILNDPNALDVIPKPKDIHCFDKAKILPIAKADNIYAFSFIPLKENPFYDPFTTALFSSKENSRFAYYVLKNLIGIVALSGEKEGTIETRVDGYRFKNLSFYSQTKTPRFYLLYSDLDNGRHYMQVTSLSNSKNKNDTNVHILGILANQ